MKEFILFYFFKVNYLKSKFWFSSSLLFFLVSAFTAFQTEANLYLILDYIPGGELYWQLEKEKNFSEKRVQLYAAEIALALGHLHQMGVIFRDLRLYNILVDIDGHLKLADYGIARGNQDEERSQTSKQYDIDYLAPEMLKGKEYTKDVDWWSLGTILFEMLNGLPPFYEKEDVHALIRKILNSDIEYPTEFSQATRDFISKLLNKDPAKRLGSGPEDIEEIKRHPFFEGLNWDDVMNKKIKAEWIPEIKDETDTSLFDQEITSINLCAQFH